MMAKRASIVVLSLATALAPLGGQRGPVTVRGVVFDSLRSRPLRAAFVTIGNQAPAIATDSAGRFRFEGIEPGVYTITAQHPLFDSIGLSGLAVRATVRTGDHEIQLSVPSFQSLWSSTCPGRAPKDSGIVFGTIRNASTGAVVDGANVALTWIDLLMDDGRRVVERHWSMAARTNARGDYAMCGAPLRVGLRVRAQDDSNSSATIDLTPTMLRLTRRDLTIGPEDGAARGWIAGFVTDAAGRAIVGARVRSSGDHEVRTDPDGHFMLRDVPIGTRQIEALTVGASPAYAAADVRADDTSRVFVRLQKTLTLEAMRSMAARGNRVLAAEFSERRRLGIGYAKDSADIRKYSQFLNVFRDIPSLDVRYGSSTLTITVPDGRGGTCQPTVLIDGTLAAFGHLVDLMPNEVAAVEVYPRAGEVPARFAPTGIRPSCGMILVWTQYGFRNR